MTAYGNRTPTPDASQVIAVTLKLDYIGVYREYMDAILAGGGET
jgi:hypothetical protein